jgi:LysM repeat protein
MDQKNRGRARVRIAVFVVLAIHGVGLLALLMQGCKKEEAPPLSNESTNAAPVFVEPTNTPPPLTNSPPATNPPTVTEQPPSPPTLPPVATATDYRVAQGDTFSSIAKKFHVSTKAVSDANPGVDSTKLQIGQTLHIPAPTPGVGTNGASGAISPETVGGSQTYSVKSGDTLTSIASHFGVSIKALRSVNHLTTDKIRVGQKLIIPAKTTAPTGGSSSTSAPPAQ